MPQRSLHHLLLLATALVCVGAVPDSAAQHQARALLQYESEGASNDSAAAQPGTGPVNITQVVQAVQAQLQEPQPHIFSLKTEYNAGGSSISVGEDYAANTLAVQFRFNACTGTQLHHHSNLELMQAATGSSVTVGIISPSSKLMMYNFTAGQAVVIPSGYVHYYLNLGCDPAILIATWPAGTKTTFELAMLTALPPDLMAGLFATTSTPPTPKAGFPMIQDLACLQRCLSSAANSSGGQSSRG